MFKKLIAASALLALFACSSKDDDNDDGIQQGGTSSSSSGGSAIPSSSSATIAKGPVEVRISEFKGKSTLLGTYPYSYTLKAGDKEDLTQFWDPACPLDTGNEKPGNTCELDKTNAILQNTLTSQYSPLHYIIDGFSIGYPNEAIKLNSYKLTGENDQAALGLNAGDGANEGKNFGELGKTELDSIIEFVYRYWGGTHEFRAVSKNDDDFWYYKAPKTAATDTVELKIPVSQLVGMGSFAENEEEGTAAVPFDISKVSKFLWVIEFDAETPANNQGSLLVDYLRSKVIAEIE